jgi:hypothetical protein
MNDITRVHKHYLATDSLLSAKESSALTSAKRNHWAEIRDVNDQAYFALIFAQFEDEVNKMFTALVNKMKARPLWSNRRAWDVIDVKNLERFAFMNRVALLSEKGQKDYNTVNSYYRTRCDIDHGNSVSGIAVTTVRDELLQIAKRMKQRT